MCGVILAGTDGDSSQIHDVDKTDSGIGTRNVINDERPDEYLHVTEYIDIAHPTPDTLAKIASLQPSADTEGDRKYTHSFS